MSSSNGGNNEWVFVILFLGFMLLFLGVYLMNHQVYGKNYDENINIVGGNYMIKVAVTGHRPERIKGREDDIKYWLEGQIKNLKACYDDVVLIDGMAQGVDQMAALAALKVGAQVSCYFPYRRKLYGVQEYIVENAKECKYIYEKFQPECYKDRDHRMVDDCDMLIVVWDGKEYGGTYDTYCYALNKGKDVLIYPWE